MVERVLEQATDKSRVKQSDIKALMKTVVSGTMQAVSKGRELAIAPTVVRNITKDIVKDFESGSIAKFEDAMARTEKLTDKLGVNIKDFNNVAFLIILIVFNTYTTLSACSNFISFIFLSH